MPTLNRNQGGKFPMDNLGYFYSGYSTTCT